VPVGVDYQFAAPELSWIIGLTQAKALVYEPVNESPDPFLALRAVRKNHPGIRIVVVGDHPVPDDCLAFRELIDSRAETESREEPSPDGPSPQDPAMIFISSGTTGKPKATLGYHGNLCKRWQRLAGWLGFRPEDVHLAQLPLSHGFGLMMAVTALLTGGKLILTHRFSAEQVLQVIGTERVTVLNGAPTHFRLILNCFDPARHDVHSLRFSVGTAASFPPSLLRSIWDDLGVEFMFMYGSSEGVGVATKDSRDILLGSVGRPDPSSVAIVGPDRGSLPPGEIGEIAFSRKVFPIRYWGESGSESPASAIPKGVDSGSDWYYSGDLGRLDDEGRLYVFGRLKHQIDRGGLKVDPVEVEGALLRCSGVSDAAVIGLPNPILGESVCACVVPKPEQALILEQLRSALSGELAPYKLPEELCILDHIPRTRIGKVNVERLQAAVMATTRQHVKQR